jgi:isopentenyl diphosphate isomerase/L-lactate dehydrogenase-like FMN-dependent dehydrogenase
MAIALGADLAAIAGSMLRAADEGEEELDAAVAEITDTLRIAMFCAGARDVGGLFREASLVERRGGAADPGAVLTGARLARRPARYEADAAGGRT